MHPASVFTNVPKHSKSPSITNQVLESFFYNMSHYYSPKFSSQQMTGSGGRRLGSGEIEQKGKKTHGHGQQCGDCRGQGCVRGLNGNGKNTIKIKFLKRVFPSGKSI